LLTIPRARNSAGAISVPNGGPPSGLPMLSIGTPMQAHARLAGIGFPSLPLP